MGKALFIARLLKIEGPLCVHTIKMDGGEEYATIASRNIAFERNRPR